MRCESHLSFADDGNKDEEDGSAEDQQCGIFNFSEMFKNENWGID